MTDPMKVRYTGNKPSPGLSYCTATTKMSLQLCSYLYFVPFSVVWFAPPSNKIDSLQVLSLMALKQNWVYVHGRSKSVSPSARLAIGSADKHDLENMIKTSWHGPLHWRGGSLHEVSPPCHISRMSSPDTAYSGNIILWAATLRICSESITPVIWILFDHRSIGGCPRKISPTWAR